MGVSAQLACRIALVLQVIRGVLVAPQHSVFLQGEEVVVSEPLNFVHVGERTVIDLFKYAILDPIHIHDTVC